MDAGRPFLGEQGAQSALASTLTTPSALHKAQGGYDDAQKAYRGAVEAPKKNNESEAIQSAGRSLNRVPLAGVAGAAHQQPHAAFVGEQPLKAERRQRIGRCAVARGLAVVHRSG